MPLSARALGGTALAASLLLPLAACSGSDEKAEGPSDEDVAAVAVASNMTSISPDLALCTAKALVKDVTVQGLQDAKILDEDLVARSQANAYDDETATAITTAAMGCWDWEKYAMGIAAAFPRATDAQWAQYQACLGELDDELEKSLYASYYTEGKASDRLIFQTEEQLCRDALGGKKGKKSS